MKDFLELRKSIFPDLASQMPSDSGWFPAKLNERTHGSAALTGKKQSQGGQVDGRFSAIKGKQDHPMERSRFLSASAQDCDAATAPPWKDQPRRWFLCRENGPEDRFYFLLIYQRVCGKKRKLSQPHLLLFAIRDDGKSRIAQ